jgi:hypothetical protein
MLLENRREVSGGFGRPYEFQFLVLVDNNSSDDPGTKQYQTAKTQNPAG